MFVVKVLLVCLGNICRSPTAHGVLRQRIQQQNLSDKISVDSAGTAAWHVGKASDPRSISAAAERGYDLSDLRARQVTELDFDRYDYIMAMDTSNLEALNTMRTPTFQGELDLFMRYAESNHQTIDSMQVPDPYYGGEDGFFDVIDRVERASDGLLNHIRQRYELTITTND